MRVFAIAIAIGIAGVAAAAPNKPKPAPKKPPPPPPPSPEKIRADKLFQDGRNYLAAKEYALACTAFEQSFDADPAIGTQLNIALCYEEWGKVVAAYKAYVAAEKLATEKKDNRAAGAQKKVDELAPKVPHLEVSIPADADPSTVYLLDGKEIEKAKLTEDQLIEIGKHTIIARTPDKPAKETAFVIAEGDRKKLTIDVPHREKPTTTIVTGGKRKPGKLYGGIGLMVGGAAAIGVAGYVSLVARQDYADALDNCPEHACLDQQSFDITQDARKKANLMTFVGAGGLVVAGVGAYLVLTSKTPKKTETVVAPVITPSTLGIAIGGVL